MKALILSLIVTSLLIFSLPKTEAHYTSPIKPETPQIKELVLKYATQYKVSEKALNRVIACESGGKINAIHYNDGGKGKHSVGVLQFQESTFNTWEKKLGEDLDYYSYHDQIKLGAYMWSKGQQRQWTCYRHLYS